MCKSDSGNKYSGCCIKDFVKIVIDIDCHHALKYELLITLILITYPSDNDYLLFFFRFWKILQHYCFGKVFYLDFEIKVDLC